MTAGASTVGYTTYANNPSTTIATNGYNGSSSTGDAPSALTQESWTVTSGASFPNASPSVTPTQGYHIADVAAPTEIILVTNNSNSGTSWTVTRGVEGTTPVTHAAGATFYQIVSADDLTSMKQATGALTSAVSFNGNTTLTEQLICSYQPITNEIVAGTTFEMMATGIFRASSVASPILQWNIRWGWVSSGTPGTSLLTLTTGTGCVALTTASITASPGSPFELQATVVFVSTTSAVANINFWYQNGTGAATGISNVASNSTATTGLTAPPGGGPLALTAKFTAPSGASTNTNTGLTVPAPLAFRMA